MTASTSRIRRSSCRTSPSADGYNGAHQATCTANTPKCWYGGVDGGGAIYVEGGQFKAVNSRFVNNRCYANGPDLGGGAIRALAQYHNRPIYITNDTFRGGRCSNGGALSSISVQWDVLNSVFTNNKAIGWGANPASPGTPGGGSGGAIYLDGKDDNVSIHGSVMNNNTAREGGGAVFDVVDAGWGALTFNRVAPAQQHQRKVRDQPRRLLPDRRERQGSGHDQVHRPLTVPSVTGAKSLRECALGLATSMAPPIASAPALRGNRARRQRALSSSELARSHEPIGDVGGSPGEALQGATAGRAQPSIGVCALKLRVKVGDRRLA